MDRTEHSNASKNTDRDIQVTSYSSLSLCPLFNFDYVLLIVDHSVVLMILARVGEGEASWLVREEVVVALHNFVLVFENQFVSVVERVLVQGECCNCVLFSLRFVRQGNFNWESVTQTLI